MMGYSGLSLDSYLKGQKATNEIVENALDLLARVEGLLLDIGWPDGVVITSGYRSSWKNRFVGGKRYSWHIKGKAVDIRDIDHQLYDVIEARSELLEKHGLWMEDKRATPTWVHLDAGIRPARKVRIFLP